MTQWLLNWMSTENWALGLSISTKISTIYLQYVSDVGVVVCDLSSGGAGRAGGQWPMGRVESASM